MEIQTILSKYKNETKSYTKKERVDGKYPKIWYHDIVCTFDIETSSFYMNEKKQAIMYIWMMSVNGDVIFGRTWDQFKAVIYTIAEEMQTDFFNRFAIYVHNLAYEFQFINRLFDWETVFALDERKPVKALMTNGIELKCSYIASSSALRNLHTQITKHKIKKMDGDLDYNLIRTSDTELTEKEIGYCTNDVLVPTYYIQEKMEESGGMAHMKLTNTSHVRDYVRSKCLPDGKDAESKKKRKKYTELMQLLILTPDEYKLLKRSFAGGFTHTSAHTSGKMLKDLKSLDFASSYPAVILSEKFPMGRGELTELTSIEYMRKLSKNFGLVFDVEFKNIEVRDDVFDCYWSESKCYESFKTRVDNGRIVSADAITTTMTEIDFEIMAKCYTWSEVRFGTCYRYFKDYLPKDFLEAVLYFYEGKTTLKGIEDQAVLYNMLKGMLNSCYGMMVTDIVRDDITFAYDTWSSETPDLYKKIDMYNNSSGRFLFYPWGVYVTAYARRNLWTGILEFGSDYHYSDTDSLKVTNIDKHMDYINKYNDDLKYRLRSMCDYRKIDEKKLHPKNIKGEERWIGIWDDDGDYSYFKALGAKRYMYCDKWDNSMHLTIAGVAKSGMGYLCTEFGEGYEEKSNYFATNVEAVFDAFTDNLIFPRGSAGKNTHTYIDEPIEGVIEDYQGHVTTYSEESCVHMEPVGYELTISDEYVTLLTELFRKDGSIHG